jgi:hypothetical protein
MGLLESASTAPIRRRRRPPISRLYLSETMLERFPYPRWSQAIPWAFRGYTAGIPWVSRRYTAGIPWVSRRHTATTRQLHAQVKHTLSTHEAQNPQSKQIRGVPFPDFPSRVREDFFSLMRGQKKPTRNTTFSGCHRLSSNYPLEIQRTSR